MTKKSLIIIISCVLVIALGVFGYYLYNNKIVSTITLDINPSVKINIARNNKVKSVEALNNDAEEIVSGNLTNITLEEAISTITSNVIEKGYAEEDKVVILVYSESKTDLNVKKLVEESFTKNNIQTDIVEIKEITEEAKELAEKYNITPAKAAYIETVTKENENIVFETMIEKPVAEIKETKDTGKYCDAGYTLDGDFCVKEIEREIADQGEVCPGGSYPKNDKCYLAVVPSETDEYECEESFKLSGTVCEGTRKMDATGDFKCSTGTPIKRSEAKNQKYRDSGNRDEMVCEDTSNAVKAHLRCLDKPHIITSSGVCADGPKPTINGGCPNGDLLVGDGCYTRDPDNDNSDYVCPDGRIYKKNEIDLCPDTFKYTKATGEYTCPNDFTLNGTMCEKKETYDAPHKVACDAGYTLEDNQCVNYKTELNKVPGFVCDKENSKVVGNYCITYDIVDAKW